MRNETVTYTPEEDQLILDREFQWVRTTFFVNFDRAGEWNIEPEYLNCGWGGLCDLDEKKIFIHNSLLRRRDGKLRCPTLLKKTIIHELAHAETLRQFNHGRRWRLAMSKYTTKARQLGMRSLANLLSRDRRIYFLSKGNRVNAKVVYTKIRELLWKSPESTFEELMFDIDYLYGLANPLGRTVLDKQFTLCRRIYDTEKRKISRSKRYFFIYSPEDNQLILDREFRWIRKNFFPHWDLAGEWTIKEFDLYLGYAAFVNRQEKTISIHTKMLRKRDGKLCCPTVLRVNIIDQIARAIAPERCNRGRRWLNTIGNSITGAKQLNMKGLANMLSREHGRYQDSRANRVYAKTVYRKIREIFWDFGGNFGEIMHEIDCWAGLGQVGSTVLDKKFKLCRKVYDVERRKFAKSNPDSLLTLMV